MATAFYDKNTWSSVSARTGGNMKQANGVAIHHTATPNAPQSFDAAWLSRVERAEMNQGYSSLAYHRMVFQDGSVAGSRDWGTAGAATGGHNNHTVAICAAGYFHPDVNDTPSEALLEAIADEIVWGTLNGYIAQGATILGHRDWTRGTQWATACPGDSLDPRVNGLFGIAARVAYKLERAPILGVPEPLPASQPRCVNTCSKRVLKKGSSGVCVKTLQNSLRAKGFDPGSSDGQFGKKTFDAVVCFQGSAGLSKDGVVGPATWAALG
jgi:hypothetical protein